MGRRVLSAPATSSRAQLATVATEQRQNIFAREQRRRDTIAAEHAVDQIAFGLLHLHNAFLDRVLGDELVHGHGVLLANAVPGVVSGGVLAFARGLGEFGATAMIAGNIAGKTRTLPMAVYSEVAAGNMEAAYSYVAIIVVIAFLSVFLMNGVMWYSQKKSR